MAEVVPRDWAKSIAPSLETLMNAVSETDDAIRDALREQDLGSEELAVFTSRFDRAQYQFVRLLLDAFRELESDEGGFT